MSQPLRFDQWHFSLPGNMMSVIVKGQSCSRRIVIVSVIHSPECFIDYQLLVRILARFCLSSHPVRVRTSTKGPTLHAQTYDLFPPIIVTLVLCTNARSLLYTRIIRCVGSSLVYVSDPWHCQADHVVRVVTEFAVLPYRSTAHCNKIDFVLNWTNTGYIADYFHSFIAMFQTTCTNIVNKNIICIK